MTQNDHTIGSLLLWATETLTRAAIPTARLDSLILLEDVLRMDRAHLLAHTESQVSEDRYSELAELVGQREKHIPLAYLRGKALFYGRTFYVTTDTLVPRPESEDFISILKDHFGKGPDEQAITIADIGTGTGCLGITAALELSHCHVSLYDIDAKAIAVAKKNAQLHNVPAKYFQENLLSKAQSRKYDIVLANLPYVPDDFAVNQDAQFEPSLALFAGSDGLDSYRSFWQEITGLTVKPRHVLTESIPELQHRDLKKLANSAGYKLTETVDFIQYFALSNQ